MRLSSWHLPQRLSLTCLKCALPGISFARNYNYRSELDDWLRAVECRKVIVAFDDEDKSGKPLRQRLDAADLDVCLQHDPLRLHRVRAACFCTWCLWT